MKTIDDLLAYERNRTPDPEPLIQKPSESDANWEARMKRAVETAFTPTDEREVVMQVSREGYIAYQDALRQYAEEDKQLLWSGGRQSGKTDATLAMGMAMIAQDLAKKK